MKKTCEINETLIHCVSTGLSWSEHAYSYHGELQRPMATTIIHEKLPNELMSLGNMIRFTHSGCHRAHISPGVAHRSVNKANLSLVQAGYTRLISSFTRRNCQMVSFHRSIVLLQKFC